MTQWTMERETHGIVGFVGAVVLCFATPTGMWFIAALVTWFILWELLVPRIFPLVPRGSK